MHRLTELFRERPFAVALHGGEPLTAGRDYVTNALYELAVPSSVVRVSLQTNGVMLGSSG
ncbi:hypothetical protein [Streptomyces lydicus]|uniref:hypothetical protein n=1 Tax=Streptomyces lydicus TaxID=47763 RepID=UPI0037891E19